MDNLGLNLGNQKFYRRPHSRMKKIFSIPLHESHEEAPKSVDANTASQPKNDYR
jgi:hypothetical protein